MFIQRLIGGLCWIVLNLYLSSAVDQTALPGIVLTYTHILTNEGTTTHSYTLTVESSGDPSVTRAVEDVTGVLTR